MHELSPEHARRVAVRAQLLCHPRPTDVEAVVEHLTMLQLDPTQVIAPHADLLLWSRLGSVYDRDELAVLLESGRLLELDMRARPAADLALYTAEMAAWPGDDGKEWQHRLAAWVDDNDACRRDVLETLRQEGPLPASALPRTIVNPWRSSGWSNDKSVLKLLDLMSGRGEVAVVGREGRHRLWDLAERVFPDDEPVPLAEALAERGRRRLAALGIARARAAATPVEPNHVGEVGEPAVVEGVKGRWRVDPRYLDEHADPFEGRTAILSPLDQLLFDRTRMEQLFGFDYQLEMYKPVAQRRFGYWAMPVLHGCDLIGKVDATAEVGEGVLRVDAVHEDRLPATAGGPSGQPWSAAVRRAVHTELEDLATWLGVEVMLGPGVTAP
ncbi:DNA glycosylase AlkZ-like family protein [Nocardioides acrostichi]|uniref:YcaQ family DNA glycosylase n=1 Tax=Nocardioides acrostichi TaxID=2784339 RepID=A0A930UZJ4_9ACTN|nr:crosslink repair DNA glycosylase YcaQ family protein [Nocardioides acrostichi]MBF4161920.1 YcaQ family DNA glycosylase [Nocardioides acrostichi]